MAFATRLAGLSQRLGGAGIRRPVLQNPSLSASLGRPINCSPATQSGAADAGGLTASSGTACGAFGLCGPIAQQLRFRAFLMPMATKGFRASRFEHQGQAVQFARESKRIPVWKLAWAGNMSVRFLRMVERGEARLPNEQRVELERLLGVKFGGTRKSKLERTP
eukprot:TRINITY_DN122695_c0_g1_i1.p1 TRINITY_DN122695_c0_g1~~TRINITY_DN122695_c0_g1_i1.p1  ORF type:complete len:164 (+),score=25.78 TRINITY_DN122695_c0_g1_i1:69-560(+)